MKVVLLVLEAGQLVEQTGWEVGEATLHIAAGGGEAGERAGRGTVNKQGGKVRKAGKRAWVQAQSGHVVEGP